MKALCVFCGSRPGRGSDYVEAAEGLGRLLAEQGVTLVYGGAGVGTMGSLARAALTTGGEVVGIIPAHLVDVEAAPGDLTTLHRVGSMHERKALMAELSDAFVALPGGMGTLEELAEAATWTQIGLHAKPVGLLNVAGYYDRLLAFLDHATEEQFLQADHRALVLDDPDPESLLAALRGWRAPTSVADTPAPG